MEVTVERSASTFADLPEAMVRDLLKEAIPVAEDVRNRIERLRSKRNEWRNKALSKKKINRKADLEVTREPSVVGIDGSYQIHRLTALDLCAAAAVGIEGTVKEARRHWPEPHHLIWVGGIPHSLESTSLLRGLMMGMELDLISQAPHDIVFLDGSFVSLITYLNQGLEKIAEDNSSLSNELGKTWKEKMLFDKLLSVLNSERTIAVPKFTAKNEVIRELSLGEGDYADGKTLATMLLEPGEYFGPWEVATASSDGKYHLPKSFVSSTQNETLDNTVKKTKVVYYRPWGWLPAYRLELPYPMATSPTRLSMALEGIYRQLFSPAVVEPYPLFLADRMVKSLGAGVGAIEQTVAQYVADVGTDAETTMLYLQNYRTEGGRGGV